MSPARLRELRAELARWNHRQDRAREEYRRHPIASLNGRGDGECDMPYCDRPRHKRGLCDRHRRLQEQDRGENGAA